VEPAGVGEMVKVYLCSGEERVPFRNVGGFCRHTKGSVLKVGSNLQKRPFGGPCCSDYVFLTVGGHTVKNQLCV